MPTTYNGVGTHYYGKRNPSTRRDYCRSCNRLGDLKSYDTRLWFVIFFIPVIPIGRKRIIDECPACSRHYAANLQQWEIDSQVKTSGAIETFRNQPTPASALEAHGMLLAFSKREEARTFREEVLQLFGDREDLLLGFAEQLDQLNSIEEATPYYERQLKLDANSPQARIGMAFRKINANNLDEARSLLKFLMHPGTSKLYNLGVLETLADCYQKSGNHDEALKIYQFLLQEVPAVGQIHSFRKKIVTSEKKSTGATSILPTSDLKWWQVFVPSHKGFSSAARFWAYTGVVTALVMVSALARNEYIRRHRTLYVVNNLSQNVSLFVGDKGPIQLGPLTHVTLAEGKHRIKTNLPHLKEDEIEVQSGYFERWWSKPAWVYNVAGAGAYAHINLVYSKIPRDPTHTLHIGEKIVNFPHIDYAFEDPPSSIKVKGNRDVAKSALQIVTAPPKEIVMTLFNQKQYPQVLDITEGLLSSSTASFEFPTLYQRAATASGEQQRAVQFLNQIMDGPPLNLECHRAYQDLLDTAQGHEKLVADYSARLKKTPQEGRLMYLYARLLDGTKEQTDLFQASGKASPDLYWPKVAMSYDAVREGNWNASLEYLQEAEQRKAPLTLLVPLRHEALLGTGGAEELTKQYRQKDLLSDFGSQGVLLRADALVIAGRKDEALRDFQSWMGSDPKDPQVVEYLRTWIHYLAGEFQIVEKYLARARPDYGTSLKLPYTYATGKMSILEAAPNLVQESEDAWDAVGVAICYELNNKKPEAEKWRAAAIKKLEAGSYDDSCVAKMLKSKEAPDYESLRQVTVSREQRMLLLADAALRFPKLGPKVAPVLEKLCVSRKSPDPLIRRVLTQKPWTKVKLSNAKLETSLPQ